LIATAESLKNRSGHSLWSKEQIASHQDITCDQLRTVIPSSAYRDRVRFVSQTIPFIPKQEKRYNSHPDYKE
jgi:hypothetical protein